MPTPHSTRQTRPFASGRGRLRCCAAAAAAATRRRCWLLTAAVPGAAAGISSQIPESLLASPCCQTTSTAAPAAGGGLADYILRPPLLGGNEHAVPELANLLQRCGDGVQVASEKATLSE